MALFQRKNPENHVSVRPKTMGKRERARIWKEAVAAATEAAKNCTPTPMIVTQHKNPLDDRSKVVRAWQANEGVCGFAWVRMKGNTAMARFLTMKGIARSAYPSGVSISASAMVPQVGQSLERGEAAVRAAVNVLRANNIDCWVESRMD